VRIFFVLSQSILDASDDCNAFRNLFMNGIGLANILDQIKELFGTAFHHDYDHHVTAACSQFGKTI
jgi:hypothetical protein